MSLFGVEHTGVVFPEATNRGDNPNRAPFEAIGDVWSRQQRSAGRLAVTGGRKDAIGDLLEGDAEFEETEIMTMTRAALSRTKDLFSRADIVVPKDLEELGDVDWGGLQEQYKYLENFPHLKPRVLISPRGMSLRTWEDFYASLAGGGKASSLEPEHGARQGWDSLVGGDTGWTTSVVCNRLKALKDFGHDGPRRVSDVGKESFGLAKATEHPTVEQFLTLYAMEFAGIQEATGAGSQFPTWLKRPETMSDQQAPAAWVQGTEVHISYISPAQSDIYKLPVINASQRSSPPNNAH